MSESDSFIQEVTEEVRQDRMFKLWKRYAPFVIGAIILIVGAAAVWNWMEHRAVIEARERGGAFLAAEPESVEAHEALAEELDDAPAAVVAEMRLAAAKAKAGDGAGAADIYRAIADRSDLIRAYRDLALLLALKLDAATAEPEALMQQIEPLVEEGAPYRALALELRGALALNAGDAEAARADLSAALTDPTATGETRRRVVELLSAAGS